MNFARTLKITFVFVVGLAMGVTLTHFIRVRPLEETLVSVSRERSLQLGTERWHTKICRQALQRSEESFAKYLHETPVDVIERVFSCEDLKEIWWQQGSDSEEGALDLFFVDDLCEMMRKAP